MRYGMVIDTKLCFGCHSCSVACKLSNNLPDGIWWNAIETVGGATMDTAGGTFPNNTMEFFPRSCQHCTNAPCVEKCPTGAAYKREDGIVLVDGSICIGCGACIEACPYDVRTLYTEAPQYYSDFALGEYDAPAHTVNTAEKCTLCANLLDRGEEPACVRACMNHARIVGDLDDPNSAASKAIEGRQILKWKEEKGTEPNVIYLL